MKTLETLRATIEDFLAGQAFAVVGVSANRKKFGNVVYRAMRDSGRTVYPLHPTHETVEGEKCYAKIAELPAEVKSVVTVVPPAITRTIVAECKAKGITSIWMQQGSESGEVIAEAERAGLRVIHGQCILMSLEPVRSIHAFHRWINRLIGKYPR